jgi:hypothetical protein
MTVLPIKVSANVCAKQSGRLAVARKLLKDGAPGTTRTCDPLIRSQVLYPAELRVRGRQFTVSSFKFQVRNKTSFWFQVSSSRREMTGRKLLEAFR